MIYFPSSEFFTRRVDLSRHVLAEKKVFKLTLLGGKKRKSAPHSNAISYFIPTVELKRLNLLTAIESSNAGCEAIKRRLNWNGGFADDALFRSRRDQFFFFFFFGNASSSFSDSSEIYMVIRSDIYLLLPLPTSHRLKD